MRYGNSIWDALIARFLGFLRRRCMVDFSERDIGYRIWRPDMVLKLWDAQAKVQTQHFVSRWFEQWGSAGGQRGVFESIESARRSAAANKIPKNAYEIWKVHIGLPSSIPWFPPEKVYG
jgi:hypothetical protein